MLRDFYSLDADSGGPVINTSCKVANTTMVKLYSAAPGGKKGKSSGTSYPDCEGGGEFQIKIPVKVETSAQFDCADHTSAGDKPTPVGKGKGKGKK